MENFLPTQVHPNIKLFISHGGLIGLQEAIFNGIPLVGVPIYADQYNNLLTAEQAGFCKILLYNDINENTLYNTVSEILNDNSYMEKAKEVSRRFKDRPMSALDTAMFWIEYVIRNKGAEYMKNPARNMSWFASSMIDVYATILLASFIGIVVLVKIIKSLLSLLSFNKVEINKKKKVA